MSVSSFNKADKYSSKYGHMKEQLKEMNDKMERINNDIKSNEDKMTDKLSTLEDSYKTKLAYYKKCIEEAEKKYKRENEDIVKKITDKVDKAKKEFIKSEKYKETVQANIDKLLKEAEENCIEFDKDQ